MSVSFSPDARTEILQRFDRTEGRSGGKKIPLLVWSQKTSSEDKLGNRTELGPMFFFFWTSENEVELDDYYLTELAPSVSLALAPGSLFRSDGAEILLEDKRLLLRFKE